MESTGAAPAASTGGKGSRKRRGSKTRRSITKQGSSDALKGLKLKPSSRGRGRHRKGSRQHTVKKPNNTTTTTEVETPAPAAQVPKESLPQPPGPLPLPLPPIQPPPSGGPTDLQTWFPYNLQQSGIKWSVIRAIVCLYEEGGDGEGEKKPDDPFGYICHLLGAGIPKEDRISKYEAYLRKLREQYTLAKNENADLTTQYLAKQVEHRRQTLLQQKCLQQKQRAEHIHTRRSLLRSRTPGAGKGKSVCPTHHPKKSQDRDREAAAAAEAEESSKKRDAGDADADTADQDHQVIQVKVPTLLHGSKGDESSDLVDPCEEDEDKDEDGEEAEEDEEELTSVSARVTKQQPQPPPSALPHWLQPTKATSSTDFPQFK